jgi:transcriptional regulator with XRE-family HTH domain
MTATYEMTIEQRFGYLVRETRKQRGITMQKFADDLREVSGGAMKLNPSSVTRIEQANRDVSLLEAAWVARVLKVSLSALLAEDESEVEDVTANLQGAIAVQEITQIIRALANFGYDVIEQPRSGADIVAKRGKQSITLYSKMIGSSKSESL